MVCNAAARAARGFVWGRVGFGLLRGRLVSGDNYPFARERISELIDSAHTAVGQIQDRQDADPAVLFKATWTTSRAAGFLEAFALVDPALAGDMLADFESVAALVDQLRAADPFSNDQNTISTTLEFPSHALSPHKGEPGLDRRATGRPASTIRRITVRRAKPERRIVMRRQLQDRRGH
jgi:hypothetical protein